MCATIRHPELQTVQSELKRLVKISHRSEHMNCVKPTRRGFSMQPMKKMSSRCGYQLASKGLT